MPLKRLSAAFAARSSPTRAALWMIVAAAFFAAMSALIRKLSEDLHALEIVFFRNLAGFAFMVPWLVRTGLRGLRTDNTRLYLGRSLIGLLSMFAWFTALTMMPLAEATALAFTAPLFATVAAVLILGETVRARRWSATIVGFIGAMIVLRPGFGSVGLPEMLVLLSAAIQGLNIVLVRQLSRVEDPNAVVTYMTLYIIPFSLVPALFVWTNPPLHTWIWIALLGLCGTAGHQAFTRAFAISDASALLAFDYAKLPIVALIAWLAFGEAPDVWTWIGAAVIVGATVYIARREAAIARRTAAKPPAPSAAHAAND
ncbi:MAG TPA: DMT family transporter [Alphaproteobacteria bacterium]